VKNITKHEGIKNTALDGKLLQVQLDSKNKNNHIRNIEENLNNYDKLSLFLPYM
jgi:hypothetical protein